VVVVVIMSSGGGRGRDGCVGLWHVRETDGNGEPSAVRDEGVDKRCSERPEVGLVSEKLVRCDAAAVKANVLQELNPVVCSVPAREAHHKENYHNCAMKIADKGCASVHVCVCVCLCVCGGGGRGGGAKRDNEEKRKEERHHAHLVWCRHNRLVLGPPRKVAVTSTWKVPESDRKIACQVAVLFETAFD
jgi:hypothetical protein